MSRLLQAWSLRPRDIIQANRAWRTQLDYTASKKAKPNTPKRTNNMAIVRAGRLLVTYPPLKRMCCRGNTFKRDGSGDQAKCFLAQGDV